MLLWSLLDSPFPVTNAILLLSILLLRRNEQVLSQFFSAIEPSLISSIGSPLKVLDVALDTDDVNSYQNGRALVQLLPRLVSLQHLILSGWECLRLSEKIYFKIPQRVRYLTLGDVGAEELHDLGYAAPSRLWRS